MKDWVGIAFPKSSKTVLKSKPKDISKTNRENIKKLFKGKCGLCGRAGVHIHHIIYKSEDRSKIDDFNNLILLCLECHQKVHSNKKYWQPRLIKLRKKIGDMKNGFANEIRKIGANRIREIYTARRRVPEQNKRNFRR